MGQQRSSGLLLLLILAVNMFTATTSTSPLLSPHRYTPNSHFTPKQFPKCLPCPLWSSSFSLCLRPLPRKSTAPVTFCSASMAAGGCGGDVSEESTPLLSDFEFPPFDAVEARHVRPAIRELLRRLERDLDELERTVEPTWTKLVEPLERIVDRLVVVWGAINHLKMVKDSAELRIAIEEVQVWIKVKRLFS